MKAGTIEQQRRALREAEFERQQKLAKLKADPKLKLIKPKVETMPERQFDPEQARKDLGPVKHHRKPPEGAPPSKAPKLPKKAKASPAAKKPAVADDPAAILARHRELTRLRVAKWRKNHPEKASKAGRGQSTG